MSKYKITLNKNTDKKICFNILYSLFFILFISGCVQQDSKPTISCSCDDVVCFSETITNYYSNCTDSIITFTCSANETIDAILKIDITKKENCEFFVSYPKNQDKELEGKDMICSFPLPEMLKISETGLFFIHTRYCSGPLKDIFEIRSNNSAHIIKDMRARDEACRNARLMIERGFYYDQNLTLELKIINYGNTSLNLQFLLVYPEKTIINNQSLDIPNNTTTFFTLHNVRDDLIRVEAQSTNCTQPCFECPNIQDFLQFIDIKGLGYF